MREKTCGLLVERNTPHDLRLEYVDADGRVHTSRMAVTPCGDKIHYVSHGEIQSHLSRCHSDAEGYIYKAADTGAYDRIMYTDTGAYHVATKGGRVTIKPSPDGMTLLSILKKIRHQSINGE